MAPTYLEFRRIDADPDQIEEWIKKRDRYTARLFDACAADPGLEQTEFEVFSSRLDAHRA